MELQCGGELRGNSTSGDLDLRNVNAARISIQSTSGDVTARNLICPTLTANSTSGDVEIEDVASASTLAASSKSGDVSLMCFEDWDTIKLQSTSGDLELREVSARHIILSTVSGDISGTLSGSAGQYDFRARSVSGDVSG